MPVAAIIDGEARYVTLDLRGEVTEREISDVRSALRRAPEFPELRGVVVDVRRNERPLSAEFLMDAARQASLGVGRYAGVRWACVVSNDVQLGNSRMFQSLAEPMGIEVGIFRDRDEAERWVHARSEPPLALGQ